MSGVYLSSSWGRPGSDREEGKETASAMFTPVFGADIGWLLARRSDR